MSLRKPITITPKRLAANRLNALRSTGPRSDDGKRRSRLNGLRGGSRSAKFAALQHALMECAPGTARRTAADLLTFEELNHPLFARTIDFWCRIHEFTASQTMAFREMRREMRRRRAKPLRALESRATRKRTRQAAENN